jgi:hypothetical protein
MLPTGNWLEINANLMIPGLWDLIVLTRANPANLFESWGKQPVFEKNAPAIVAGLKLDGSVVPPADVLALLQGTGILDPIPFRSVSGARVPSGEYDVIIASGTVAWSARRVTELKCWVDVGLKLGRLFLLAGNRQCNSSTEVDNPYVKEYQAKHGVTPTEEQILPWIAMDILGISHEDFTLISDSTLNNNIMALAQMYPDLERGMVYVPGNANAMIPLQVRRGLRTAFSGFDQNGEQLCFSQDGFPLATTPEQAADTVHYQRPLTVFAGLVRSLNEFHNLNS